MAGHAHADEDRLQGDRQDRQRLLPAGARRHRRRPDRQGPEADRGRDGRNDPRDDRSGEHRPVHQRFQGCHRPSGASGPVLHRPGDAVRAAVIPVALGLVLCAAIVPARASLFYDVTLDLGLRDDARIFLNVTNDYLAPPPAVAVDLVRRCPAPEDDYPVILLLARASKRPAAEILRMRVDYLSWSDIMYRLSVSA